MFHLLIVGIIALLCTLNHAIPPSIPLTLPTTVPFQPSNSSTNSLSVVASCFDAEQGIKPIQAYACQIARNTIRQIPNVGEDLLWSVPKEGIQILGHWEHGTCVIEVAGWTPTAEDWFSLNEVVVRAGDIIRDCVGRRVHLGGRMAVGPKKVFQVIVLHKDGISNVGSSA